ncbi:uncharacterized protein ACA1_228630 [Acanthamoeba castellanii str. Neff]|uniref:Protein kinase domain-containing protein n=1 Tax=Acanthamoeba castellanii (strain ATCC 30010 / Neff) TaxID=1257118 RepID=L8H8R5_ACACF|nr:uncharacterized protein ACA1_228630 [Acanthamoeba castellanii str. Neff]ELR21592.1 hypothetical protein ACA1_228630 [Acanthamoeba castellanii str. Neff]
MGLTTPPDVFLKHLPNILPKVEPALMQINSSELSDEVKRKRKNVAFLRALIEESKFGDNVRLAEAIMKDILSNPYFSSEPGLVMAFINYSPAFNRLLAKYIFTTRHYPMEIMREWIKSVVEKGDADRDISKFVLSKPPFTEGPDPIKDMIIKRCMGTTGRSIGPQLELTPGTVIKTSGYKLKVLSCAGKGNTGAVYKAQTMNGKGEQIVGLKVCVKYEPEVILSMQRESKKMAFLEELQVCKYTAILEAGDDYAVKEWAEGITGVEWFKVWEMDGAKTSDESFRKLIQLFRKVGEKKIYLQNFKPHNLLWDQEQRLWQVIDYGGHKALNTPEEVVEKYYEKFDDMWNKNKKLVPSCAELVRRMQREKKKLEDSRRTASSTSTPTPTPSPLSGASISTSASSSSIPAQPFNGAASVNGKAKGKEKEQQEKEKEKKEQQEQRGEKEKKEEEEEQSAAAAAAPGKKGKKSTKKEKKEEKKKEKKEKKNSSKKESIERSRSVGESEEGEEAEGGGEGGGGGGEGEAKKKGSLLMIKTSKSKKTKKR